MRSRTGIFVILALSCTLVAAAAVVSAVVAQGNRAAMPVRSAALARPYVIYRSLEGDAGSARFGELASTSAAKPGGARRLTGRVCERIHAGTAGALCVARGASLLGAYEALLLAPDGHVRHKLALSGVPSRARLSPDGRYGATTMFVTGHSYAKPGQFSTQTTIIDMRAGKAIAELETFTVSRSGRVVDAADVQFWGVTFARDSDRFYATLATGGKTYLIDARVSTRTAKVIRTNVECPSLSPDGTRIGYKKLVGSNPAWRFHVLDLATGRETPLAETRPIDDQLEWLDDGRVLYGSGHEIWTAPADGSGYPRRFLPNADSPAVVR